MNLPSFTRALVATGVFSLCFLLSAHAATPPVLRIDQTAFSVGSVVSGSAAHLNGHVYYAGGTLSGGSVTNVVTDINTLTRSVTQLPGMPTARAGLGLVAFLYTPPGGVQNVLFAIGGTSGSSALSANEMFSFATGSWSAMAPMPTPRAYLTVVAGIDGKIYAIGGVDGSGHTVATVEVYNPTTNTWAAGPSLNTPRSHLAGTEAVDFLFVAGGQDASGTILNTTEIYSLSAGGSWTNWFPMHTARADFGISQAGDGFLHAFGGRSTTGNVKTIEGYNFTTGVWTIEPHNLPTVIEGAAVTEGLTGADYVLGGKNGTKFDTTVTKGFPPIQPAHNVTFFVHGFDEPYVNGNFAMDNQSPLSGLGLLSLAILSSTNFSTFPAVTGTIGSGGSLTVTVPGTIILGVINGLTVSATNLDGSNPVVIGSASSLLGLSGTVNIPITTPLKITNKVLVLNISTILGLDLNLSNGVIFVTLNGLTGKPSNP
jgi:Kelch motif/Galactose oxidase, central domain